MEEDLSQYIIQCSSMNFGLSPKEVRSLAYELAKRNNINVPVGWHVSEKASKDWLASFMKRHPLSIRKPAATSVSRASCFNRDNVSTFFSLLANVMDRYKFECSDIWNTDETGITTVQCPDRVIAKRGAKQVGSVTSGEKGTLVTFAVAISASGNTIPPMFVFPRKRFQSHFISSGPPGCVGSASPSGWMTANDFFIFLEHFIKYTRCSKDRPVLLILDNHESHLSVKGIDLCKENGVVLLSLPPHCTHKMQPLDVSVYGPLKKYVNSACDSWLRNNPGKTITIYNIPEIVSTSLPLAVTPSNIKAGFSASGIYPFNKDIFSDGDFMPSTVTYREEERDIPSSQDQGLSGIGRSLSTSENQKPAGIRSSPSTSQPQGSSDIENSPSSSQRQEPPGIAKSPSTSQNEELPEIATSTSIFPHQELFEIATARSTSQCQEPFRVATCQGQEHHGIATLPSTSEDQEVSATQTSRSSSQSPSEIVPTPSTSEETRVAQVKISPEDIRPVPKASARKSQGKGRKRRKPTILTDTPNRNELNREQEETAKKKKLPLKTQATAKRKLFPKKGPCSRKNTTKEESSSSDEDETFCLMCCDTWTNSLPKEKWIQCIQCTKWAHEKCVDPRPLWVCINCDSGEESS